PQDLWTDYGGVAIAAAGWEQTLDRYGVDILVLHPKEHASLVNAVRLSHVWTAAHEAPNLFIAHRLER
ncbi:MAG: hypothetical protein U1E05_27425, partial [Patescibacteria group bacterium]|nr:hypothetical protein [Patescibacteria group bacterium]